MEQPDLPTRFGRAVAIVEVFAAFAVVHVCYRAVKSFTVIGRWEAAAGTNFIPGMVMIAFTVAALWICRRDFSAYGLTLKRRREDLSIGLTCSVVVLACAGLGLAVSGFELDASRPPDPHERPPWTKLTVAGVFLLAGFLLALAAAASRRRIFRSVPAYVSIPCIVALAAVPPLLAMALGRSHSWGTVLWLFFGAGFGEEIFFRGYIQSRVDQTWGKPYRVWGFEFGMGLLVSSLLFGLIHVLNTVDYFQGRFDFGWRMGAQSVLVGIFYGLLRARTGSIVPGAILHGLTDVLAQIPNVLRG